MQRQTAMKQPKPWYRKANDSWYVQLHGKQHRLATGRANEAAAYQAYHELMAKPAPVVEPAQPVKSTDPVVTPTDSLDLTYFDHLCAFHVATLKCDWAPKTLKQACLYLDMFNDAHPDLLVADLKPWVVLKWVNDRGVRAINTRRTMIAVVKRVTGWADEVEILEKDPLHKLKIPAMQARDTLMPPEVHKLLCQSVPKRTALALIALKHSGARPGEICRVTKDMVKLDRGQWELKEHKTKKKTGAPRLIYLTPCLATLSRILLHYRKGSHLFVNQYGRPLRTRTIDEAVNAAREKLKLPAEIVPYCHRHTYCTDGLESGVPIATMAKLMGHVSTNQINKTYGHLEKRPDHLRDAASQIQAGRQAKPNVPRSGTAGAA
jgi:integrase